LKLFQNIISLAEGNDLTELPEQGMKDIQANIRKGAQDTTQQWANALELVHKAYEVTGVERPNPNMVAAWKQYEENITFAVEQLSKARGMDADWRMTSASLHEAVKLKKFKVYLDMPDTDPIEAIAEAEDIDVIVEIVKERVKDNPSTEEYELRVDDDGKGVKITCWLHGIRNNSVIKITPTT